LALFILTTNLKSSVALSETAALTCDCHLSRTFDLAITNSYLPHGFEYLPCEFEYLL